MCTPTFIYKCYYLNILSLLANRESPPGFLLLLFLKYLCLELISCGQVLSLNYEYIKTIKVFKGNYLVSYINRAKLTLWVGGRSLLFSAEKWKRWERKKKWRGNKCERRNLGELEVSKDHVEGLEEKERDGEQTKRCWCLFSLWLVMGDCSQHKHMPSWLTHFLLHSTSQHWATQAQKTTARCVRACVACLHAWMHACSLLLWFTQTHNVCAHLNLHYICVFAWRHTHNNHTIKDTSRLYLNVQEDKFHIKLEGLIELGLFRSDLNICGLTGINTVHLLTCWLFLPGARYLNA